MRWHGLLPLLLLWTTTAHARDPGSPALTSPDAESRSRAARLAGERGRREQGEELRRLLRDESWKVRAAAAWALGQLEYEPARRELMVLAQTDFSAQVREAAAEAVKRMDPIGFASVLATADKPPVRPAPPPKKKEEKPRREAVTLGLGLGTNGLRADQSLAGQAALGLRWPHAETQLTLSFPAMALCAQVRWNILPHSRLVPYLTVGAALSYNNLQPELRRPATSLLGGAGLRLARLWRRFYVYAEVLASWVFSQGRPAGKSVEQRTVSLPLLLGAGLELWP